MEWQSKQPWHSSNLSTISRKASHHLRVAGGCWPMTGGLVYVTSASGCHQSARSSVHGSCIASHHRFLTCGHSARGSQGPDHACARSTFPHLPCPRGAVGRRVCFRPQPREDTGLCARSLAEVVRQCSPLKAECWEQSYRSSRGSEPGGGCWGRALHSVRLTFFDAV